jgi:hypothetical protein
MNDDKYAKLRELLAKASPGPWGTTTSVAGVCVEYTAYAHQVVIGRSAWTIGHRECPNWQKIIKNGGCTRGEGNISHDKSPHPDAAFIAEARNTLPTLLADLDAVTRERDDARRLYDNLCVTVDTLRTENAKLREALEDMMKKCRCRGKGVYTRDCTLCGDSTFDHVCNDEERPCTDPACAFARTTLGGKQ